MCSNEQPEQIVHENGTQTRTQTSGEGESKQTVKPIHVDSCLEKIETRIHIQKDK